MHLNKMEYVSNSSQHVKEFISCGGAAVIILQNNPRLLNQIFTILSINVLEYGTF